MPANAVVRARIDKDHEEEAGLALASIGLTVTDAFRLMLVRVVAKRNCRSILWYPMQKLLPPCRTPGSATLVRLTRSIR